MSQRTRDDIFSESLSMSPEDLTREARAWAAEYVLSRLFRLAREQDPAVTRERVREALVKHRPHLAELLPR